MPKLLAFNSLSRNLAVVALALLLGGKGAFALSCLFDPLEDFERATSVFAGEVIAVEEIVVEELQGDFVYEDQVHQKVTFRVGVIWKGSVSETKDIYYIQDDSSGIWGKMETGDTWILFSRARFSHQPPEEGDYFPEASEFYETCLGGGYIHFADGYGYLSYLGMLEPLFLREGSALAGGQSAQISSRWEWIDWIGAIYSVGDHWYYAKHLGWIYFPAGQSGGSVWLYHYGAGAVDGWVWTSREHYPWIWRPRDVSWLYLVTPSGLNRGDFLRFNSRTQEWEVQTGNEWGSLDNPQR